MDSSNPFKLNFSINHIIRSEGYNLKATRPQAYYTRLFYNLYRSNMMMILPAYDFVDLVGLNLNCQARLASSSADAALVGASSPRVAVTRAVSRRHWI